MTTIRRGPVVSLLWRDDPLGREKFKENAANKYSYCGECDTVREFAREAE